MLSDAKVLIRTWQKKLSKRWTKLLFSKA